MSDPSTNPYAPPPTPATKPPPPPLRDSRGRSLIAIAIAVVGAAAYVVFTGILLNSSGVDRKAGLLFLMNIPVLIAWLILLFRRTKFGALFGFAVVAVQGIITSMMLLFDIGSVSPVLSINSVIMAIQGAVVTLVYTLQRRSTRENEATLPREESDS